MALGRSVRACKQRFTAINCDCNRIQGTDDHGSIVTSNVQGQLESSGAVNWLQVSQATGFDLLECLELSQYDIGKASWHYNPDSFSQSMVNRMAGFIEEYYPAPALVNYQAVSNFMWIVMEDCIRIHDMLQDKFKWIEAYYEQAAAFRAQGPTFKEIAWHLFPTLTGHNVCSALKGYSSPERVLELISAGELDKIFRLVDEYAGKYTVTEIIDKIHAQLNLGKRHCWYSKFSSKWTEEETRKLVDYMQSCDWKPDYVYFSKILGTKSSRQCSGKAEYLWRKGILPHMPTI